MTVSEPGKNSAEEANSTPANAHDSGRCKALNTRFMLAGWEVDPALNKLNHPEAGQRHLEPRLMKLLCYLAANQGEVLSRDELVAELWPHVIVNENSLTRAVSELRKHLTTASTQAGKLIQTVPKRGYLLSQPVTRLPAAKASSVRGTAQADPGLLPESGLGFGTTAWQFLQRPLASASTAAALTICLTLATGFDSSDSAPVTSPMLTQLQDEVVGLESPLYGAEISLSSAWATAESAVGSIEKPAIAADGERFAFIKHDITGSAIYLGELDSDSDPVAVYMETCKISNLTWSPLGDALLFVREPGMTTAALFSTHEKGLDPKRELLSLDLQTLEVSRLVEDGNAESEEEAPISSLTYQQPVTPVVTPEKAPAAPTLALEPV